MACMESNLLSHPSWIVLKYTGAIICLTCDIHNVNNYITALFKYSGTSIIQSPRDQTVLFELFWITEGLNDFEQ